MFKDKKFWLLGVILISYLVVGFPDGAFTVSWLGIAEDIPGLSTAIMGWILVAYSVTYTLSGVILAAINKFMRLQKIYFVGLVIMAAGFLALAFSHSLPFVMTAIAIYGFGTGLMASSMNSYMAKHFTASHNNWMHFFWGAGAAASPMIMTYMMQSSSWRYGYFAIVGILAVVAVILLVSFGKRMWIQEAGDSRGYVEENLQKPKKYLEKKWYEHVQVATFFFLGGTDYTLVFFTGAVLIGRGLEPESVGIFSVLYYLFMTIARLVAGGLAKKFSEASIIRASIAISIVGILVLQFTSQAWGMMLTGFGLGPLLPTLVSDTSNAFSPKLLPRLVGYELAAFGAGIAALFFLTSQIMYFVSYELLFPLGIAFIVLVFICNEILERAVKYQNRE